MILIVAVLAAVLLPRVWWRGVGVVCRRGGVVVWCGVVWCGVAWRGVAWCDAVWYIMAWCGVVWFGTLWVGLLRLGTAWHGDWHSHLLKVVVLLASQAVRVRRTVCRDLERVLKFGVG